MLFRVCIFQKGLSKRNGNQGTWLGLELEHCNTEEEEPNMMAVILAGGVGTRLRPFSITIPKPLLPLGDVPILEIVVRQLAAVGIDRIVLTLGHMAPFFTSFIGDGKKWGVNVEYCYEEEPLGTAGPLRLIKNLEDDFIVMNGDILTTVNFKALITEHREQNAWGTIAATQRTVNVEYGVITISDKGILENYDEKPSIHYNVSMGINVLSRHCIDFIPPSQKFDMPQLMLAMKASGKRVICYKTDCYWKDIGLFEDYEQASKDFISTPANFLPDLEKE